MKNLIISTSVLLLLASLSLDTTFAQNKPTQALHQAVVSGDIDKVKSLISDGADVNFKNRMGWTPLHTAVRNSRKEIAILLIEKGADISAKAGSGQTPLHFAADTGQKDVVELLITKGADVNAISSRRENALSLAKKKGHTEIADLLVKHGATEPSLEDLQGDRFYGGRTLTNPNYQRGMQPGGRAGTTAQSPAQIKVLDDPNEIKARVKTFKGLEKTVAEVAGKSQNEVRQWQQKRYDNRTLLITSVQKQYEGELGSVRKVAVEEKAKKTTAAIDELLSRKQ
ncbi:MAG: ankyrin repeat domain-containing protein, partial [Planctomycetota bacterium]